MGTADCGYVLCDDWVKSIGKHKLVIIHRDYSEVIKSLISIGMPTENLSGIPTMLEKLNGLHIDFDDINKRLKEIHDYLELPGFDRMRARLFTNMNIQSMDWK